jgi:hypothetical protein
MKTIGILLTVVLLAVLGVVSAFALESDSLKWWTVDGGGATFSTGGSYSLGGTIGQPDAGTSSGGTYTLDGGFWGGDTSTVNHQIYLPLIRR